MQTRSTSRVLAAAGLLALALVSCTADDDISGGSATRTSTAPTPTTPTDRGPSVAPTASTDAAASRIPIEGLAGSPIDWSDPDRNQEASAENAVLTARRWVTLNIIRRSADVENRWRKAAALGDAYDAVAEIEDSPRDLFVRSALEPSGTREGAVSLSLLQAAPVSGDTVRVTICDDSRAWLPSEGRESLLDPIVSVWTVPVSAEDGIWKVSGSAIESVTDPPRDAETSLGTQCRMRVFGD